MNYNNRDYNYSHSFIYYPDHNAMNATEGRLHLQFGIFHFFFNKKNARQLYYLEKTVCFRIFVLNYQLGYLPFDMELEY